MSHRRLGSLQSGDQANILQVLPLGFEGRYGLVFRKGSLFKCSCIRGSFQIAWNNDEMCT